MLVFRDADNTQLEVFAFPAESTPPARPTSPPDPEEPPVRSYTATDDVVVLADSTEIPGLGHLPVNAFLLRGSQPLLVDTGLPTSSEAFLDSLWSACDPADLRWIWLTHPDRDHTGSLRQVLDAAPQARLITTFLGYGILSIDHDIPRTGCTC